ncbi:MAG: DNA repair protein RecO [Planctomycetota bacterium]|nr:DNA repair protein RecO [Planctomycetota bacterium]
MALITSTVLCLRKVDFSETSQILTLLSDQLGTVGAIAKGAKRAKSGTGGPLDLMCLYHVVLYDRSRRGTLSILAQAELLDFFPAARENYQSFIAIESIRELLLAIEVTPHDAPSVLLTSVKALRALCDGEPPGRVLAQFAWGLLSVLGVEPVVTECVASGIEPSGKVEVAFSLREMGLLSPPHAQHRSDLLRISPPTLAALQALATGHAGRGIPVDAYAGAFTLLAWLVAMQGGRRLRSVPPLEPARVL